VHEVKERGFNVEETKVPNCEPSMTIAIVGHGDLDDNYHLQ
jgi:hypothetical protein